MHIICSNPCNISFAQYLFDWFLHMQALGCILYVLQNRSLTDCKTNKWFGPEPLIKLQNFAMNLTQTIQYSLKTRNHLQEGISWFGQKTHCKHSNTEGEVLLMGLMIDFFILLQSAAKNTIVKPIQMGRDNNNCHTCVPPSFLKIKHYCPPPTPPTSHSFLIFSWFL